MPFRRSRSFGRRPRKRAIWINIPFTFTFGESASHQVLLLPEDWEAQFTALANEHATLRAIVGELTWAQTAVGTAGNQMFWGLCVLDKDSTVPPSFSTAQMGDADWLHCGARVVATSITASVTQIAYNVIQPIKIKAKRKLSSRDAIFIAGQFASDAATPTGTLGGILRFLVARD